MKTFIFMVLMIVSLAILIVEQERQMLCAATTVGFVGLTLFFSWKEWPK